MNHGQTIRSTFSDIKAKANELTGCHEYQQSTSRRRKRNTKYDDFSGSRTFDEFMEKETSGKQFEIEVFVVIIDNTVFSLDKHLKAYEKLPSVF